MVLPHLGTKRETSSAKRNSSSGGARGVRGSRGAAAESLLQLGVVKTV